MIATNDATGTAASSFYGCTQATVYFTNWPISHTGTAPGARPDAVRIPGYVIRAQTAASRQFRDDLARLELELKRIASQGPRKPEWLRSSVVQQLRSSQVLGRDKQSLSQPWLRAGKQDRAAKRIRARAKRRLFVTKDARRLARKVAVRRAAP